MMYDDKIFLLLYLSSVESKNDGTVEADDSEDDWTFNDYRSGGAEQSKEESVDTSSVVEVMSKHSPTCAISYC